MLAYNGRYSAPDSAERFDNDCACGNCKGLFCVDAKRYSELAKAQAALLVEESEFTYDSINEAVTRVYSDTELREKMSENIEKFAKPDVDKRIYEEITRLIRNKAKIKLLNFISKNIVVQI